MHKLREISLEQVTDLLGLLMNKLRILILSITHTFQSLTLRLNIPIILTHARSTKSVLKDLSIYAAVYIIFLMIYMGQIS